MFLLQLPFARSCCLTFFWVVFLFFDSVFPYVLIEKRSQFLPTNNTSSTRLDLPADNFNICPKHKQKDSWFRLFDGFIQDCHGRTLTHIDKRKCLGHHLAFCVPIPVSKTAAK